MKNTIPTDGYYTMDMLRDFLQDLVDDIKDVAENGEPITHTGTTSPITQWVTTQYDNEMQHYIEELSDHVDEEELEEIAHVHATNRLLNDIPEWIDDLTDGYNNAYEFLNDQMEWQQYIDKDILKENIFNHIGKLPLEWIHAMGFVTEE